VLLGCALRRSAVAELTDGRASGGFTPQATGDARHANTPELSASCLTTPSACRLSPLAVAATDDGRLAPELAAGIANGKNARSIGVRSGEPAHSPPRPVLPNAPDIATAQGLRDRALIAVLLDRGLRRSAVAALADGLFGRIHAGGDGRRTAGEYAGVVGMVPATPSACRPSARLAVAATDNGLLAPESGSRHRAREGREVESASAILAVFLGGALRRSAVAAPTNGRCSGGFTVEATVAARRASTPGLSA
jgi:hypothetical protein